jgi:predicted small lipoprotein YifL
MGRWMLSLATLLFVLTLAGCGKAAPPGSDGKAPVLVDPVCPDKPAALPGDPNAPRVETSVVPADFVTVAVVRCRSEVRDQPGQGKWSVQITERADSPATELVAELRKPSDARTAELCTLELVIPPLFFLLDPAGKAIAPAIPTDSCGKPRRDARAELDKLPFRTVSEKPVAQVQSPQSQGSGCADSWKDMFAIQAKDARRSTGSTLNTPVTTLTVCGYDKLTGDQLPVGHLSGSHAIDGEAARNLLAALDKAGPAADCGAQHTRFAVLTGPNNTGGHAMVELDGCHRLLRADGSLGQLDDATVLMVG